MKELVPGFVNEFTIKATRTLASVTIRDVSPLCRNCRFDNEMPENMTLFTNYSMSACQFECMLSY